MNDSKFRTKKGNLTPYAFACGYIEEKNGWRLFLDGCWHVRGHGKWVSFDTLAEARKFFSALIS